MNSVAPTPHTTRTTAVVLILLTLLSWAAVPLFLRHFTKDLHFDPISQNGWRYAISAGFWLPFLFFTWKRGNLPRPLFGLAIVPAIFNLFGQTFFTFGPALLEPGMFSFVFRSQIVFVTLGAYLLFPAERSTLSSPRYWTGMVMVVVGSVGLVMVKDKGEGAHAAVTFLGVAVAFLSGLFFAGYGLSVRYYVNKYSPITSFGVICQYTAVGAISFALLAPLAPGILPASLPPPDPTFPLANFSLWSWLLLIASAFIGIAISHVMYYASLSRLGVAVSIGIIQLQPIFTAVGSFLLFGERLNAWQWACGMLGVVGAMLMLKGGPKKNSRALAESEAE
ncbi:MAG: DMT family transporter [Phycisphaerales bacterium]